MVPVLKLIPLCPTLILYFHLFEVQSPIPQSVSCQQVATVVDFTGYKLQYYFYVLVNFPVQSVYIQLISSHNKNYCIWEFQVNARSILRINIDDMRENTVFSIKVDQIIISLLENQQGYTKGTAYRNIPYKSVYTCIS